METREGENDTPTKQKKERKKTKKIKETKQYKKKQNETRTTSTLQKKQAFPKAMNAQEEPEDKPL